MSLNSSKTSISCFCCSGFKLAGLPLALITAFHSSWHSCSSLCLLCASTTCAGVALRMQLPVCSVSRVLRD